MPQTREVLSGAAADLRRCWKDLALTDLAYKALTFALLAPATALLLRWVIPDSKGGVLADTDILWFFVTSPAGILSLLCLGAVVTAITVLELACLLGIGLAASDGYRLPARGALGLAAARAPRALALAAHMVLRVAAGALPFLLAGGLAAWLFLTRHDINYYLKERPPAFWAAVAVVGVLVLGLVVLLLHTLARWALILPIALFERELPRRAFAESSRRTGGSRGAVLAVLAAWAVAALLTVTVAAWVPGVLGRSLAPRLAGSLGSLLACITGLAVLWGALALLAGVFNASLFALLVNRLYVRLEPGGRRAAREPVAAMRIPAPLKAAAAALAVLGALGVALLAVAAARRNQPVLVIAHRGASVDAPENTLAAFRLAGDQRADFVELDVQESLDGQVVVVHDSDLMKVGGSPLKIWEAEAAQLRAVDVGKGERVPTLAEALGACKGRSKVVVELKSYGHAQHLEERVATVVEAAGMERDCVFMSLDHRMVARMRTLRPTWRTGILAAKAIGDLTTLPADFLAVESKLATRSFVRAAHRAGKDVYVWTVNDPAAMLGAMSRGVDGLITDRPDLARRVIERRTGMSDAQRVLVAVLVRLGVKTETLASAEALRP